MIVNKRPRPRRLSGDAMAGREGKMSMRLKVISAIMGALLLVVVGTGVYGVYSGKMGVSADSIEKMAKEKNLKASSNGVSVSIDDNVSSASSGQTIYVKARITVPMGMQFGVGKTAQNNGLFYVNVYNAGTTSLLPLGYGRDIIFPSGTTEFSIPYVVPSNATIIYSNIFLSGTLFGSGGGYGYGYNSGQGMIYVYANHQTSITSTVLPKPVTLYPENGAQNVPLNVKPKITFDQPLNPSATEFTLTESVSNLEIGTTVYSNNNRTIEFKPKKKLKANSTYTARVILTATNSHLATLSFFTGNK